MTYKQIKWLILLSPTLTIGLWEYIRHRYLQHYISMGEGNYLSTLIVFLTTIIVVRKWFAMLESLQEELSRGRAEKAALEEREKLAQELHDGIAQSLFLLSVKMDKLEGSAGGKDSEEQLLGLRKTVYQINEYVRQAIANLKYPPEPVTLQWLQNLRNLVRDYEHETGLHVEFDWTLPEETLSPKEKVELYASLREALVNIRKHAAASTVWVTGRAASRAWECRVTDDGRGFAGDPFAAEGRFGLKTMQERAVEMGWQLRLAREEGHTIVEIRKEAAK